MIVVEGVDGSGKSNLVGRLCQDFDMDCEERVVNKDTTPVGGVSLKSWVETDMRSWPRAAIYDRHRLISEPIYAPIMRGRLADGFQDPLWFGSQYSLFWKHRPIVIYCMPPPEVVIKNVLDSGEENAAVLKPISALYWLYHADYCRNMNKSNVILWDYTQDQYEDHLHYIRFILKEEHSRNGHVINQYFRDDRKTITSST
jgi:hypothetical protein